MLKHHRIFLYMMMHIIMPELSG